VNEDFARRVERVVSALFSGGGGGSSSSGRSGAAADAGEDEEAATLERAALAADEPRSSCSSSAPERAAAGSSSARAAVPPQRDVYETEAAAAQAPLLASRAELQELSRMLRDFAERPPPGMEQTAVALQLPVQRLRARERAGARGVEGGIAADLRRRGEVLRVLREARRVATLPPLSSEELQAREALRAMHGPMPKSGLTADAVPPTVLGRHMGRVWLRAAPIQRLRLALPTPEVAAAAAQVEASASALPLREQRRREYNSLLR
jgi:hypothetical protein